MKIARNMSPLFLRPVSLIGLALAVSAVTLPAYAADTAPALTPPPAATADASATASPSPSMPAPMMPMPSMANNEDKNSKNLTPLEDKVSESIKDSVKQFASTESVNLEDLNTARQAIAKLEVLIDIEKHMAELDRVRAERNKSKNLTSTIPVSALSIPPAFTAPAQTASAPPPMFTPVEHHEVSRIIGADGHYVAVISDKNYRVGDKLPDGDMIVAISARSVETKSKSGTVNTLKVKGVDQIYGHTL